LGGGSHPCNKGRGENKEKTPQGKLGDWKNKPVNERGGLSLGTQSGRGMTLDKNPNNVGR